MIILIFGNMILLQIHGHKKQTLEVTEATGFSIGNYGYIGIGDTSMGYNLSLQDFWQYNPNTNTWCQVANYGGGTREYAPAFVIGNKGYVGTGCKVVGTSYVYYKDFWEFTPAPLTPSFPAVTNVHCFGNSKCH